MSTIAPSDIWTTSEIWSRASSENKLCSGDPKGFGSIKMTYWKSKVLPKIKKYFGKGDANSKGAAEAAKSFNKAKAINLLCISLISFIVFHTLNQNHQSCLPGIDSWLWIDLTLNPLEAKDPPNFDHHYTCFITTLKTTSQYIRRCFMEW